jgi:quercetin dioxygenase-like cupin family protein
MVSVVEKPWGCEIWFAKTDKYAGKIIILNKGHKSSLQYHKLKHETIYLEKGSVILTLEDDENKLVMKELKMGEAVVIPPLRKHRVEAVEDSRIIEVSTPELDDVVRVDDSYGR